MVGPVNNRAIAEGTVTRTVGPSGRDHIVLEFDCDAVHDVEGYANLMQSKVGATIELHVTGELAKQISAGDHIQATVVVAGPNRIVCRGLGDIGAVVTPKREQTGAEPIDAAASGRSMTTSALVILSIEGVLQPTARPLPNGYRLESIDGTPAPFASAHRRWISELRPLATIAWATGWNGLEDELAKRYWLKDIPVITTSPDEIVAIANAQPIVLIAPDFDSAIRSWANDHSAPALLIETDPTLGLTATQMDEVTQFLQTQA